MSGRILVGDDEVGIRTVLREYLRSDGFEVIEATTGAEAMTALGIGSTGALPREPFDLVLLDVGLPDVDGLSVLAELRRTSEVYVILVTARAEEVDKIVGLQVGADDYITKPFSPREVAARVKAVLRRSRGGSDRAPGPSTSGGGESSMHFPELVIGPARREVIRGGRPVQLSALQFDLLLAMAGSPGRVWSRRQLLEQVWGGDFFGDERVVDVHIRNLRKALGDDASEPTIIGTARGVGYKFLPEQS